MPRKRESNVKKEKAGKGPGSKAPRPVTAKRVFTQDFLRHLFYTQGRVLETATGTSLDPWSIH